MAIAIDIETQRRDLPAWRGVFHPVDVVRWLSVTDCRIRGESLNLGPSSIHDWSGLGFFGMEASRSQYARYPEFIRFGGVITSRAVALLLSHGVRLARILDAHEYLQDATGLDFPFASRGFWVGTDGFSDDVYAGLDEFVMTEVRLGGVPFTELMYERIGDPGDMEFGDSEGEFATKWEPMPGIVINPGVQSGAACVKGTRTPTYALYGCYVAGDGIDSLSHWFELGVNEVEVAIAWEERLAAVSFSQGYAG